MVFASENKLSKDEFMRQHKVLVDKMLDLEAQQAKIKQDINRTLADMRQLSYKSNPSWVQELVQQNAALCIQLTKTVTLYGGVPQWERKVDHCKQVMELSGCSLVEAKSTLENLALERVIPKP